MQLLMYLSASWTWLPGKLHQFPSQPSQKLQQATLRRLALYHSLCHSCHLTYCTRSRNQLFLPSDEKNNLHRQSVAVSPLVCLSKINWQPIILHQLCRFMSKFAHLCRLFVMQASFLGHSFEQAFERIAILRLLVPGTALFVPAQDKRPSLVTICVIKCNSTCTFKRMI